MQQGLMVINIQTPKGMDMLPCPSAIHRLEKREPLHICQMQEVTLWLLDTHNTV